jgi:hypothetical protein
MKRNYSHSNARKLHNHLLVWAYILAYRCVLSRPLRARDALSPLRSPVGRVLLLRVHQLTVKKPLCLSGYMAADRACKAF